MKPSILKRLEYLESIVDQTSRPPLHLIDVLTFDPVDREMYWSGPEGEIAVLTAMGVPLDNPAESGIHTIIVDVSAASRDRWQQTAGMDEGDLERFEQAAILQEQIREREDREARERAAMDAIRAAEPRYGWDGYRINPEATPTDPA